MGLNDRAPARHALRFTDALNVEQNTDELGSVHGRRLALHCLYFLLFLEEAGWAEAAPTPITGADQPDAVRARGDALLFRVSLLQHDLAGISVVASVALGAAGDAEIGGGQRWQRDAPSGWEGDR